MINSLHQANAVARQKPKRTPLPSVRFHITAKDFCRLSHSIVEDRHGWQKKIGYLIGVSPSTIGRWAAGTRTADKSVIIALYLISPFRPDGPIDVTKFQRANCFAIVGDQATWYWTDLFNQTPGAPRFRHQHPHGTILPKTINPLPRGAGKTVTGSPELARALDVLLKT